MVSVFYVLMFLLSACLVLLMPVLWGWELYKRYGGSRAVTCPETHRPVAVRFAALRAAVTGVGGRPRVRLADCTRWPERADCGQECIPEACANPPYTRGEVAPAHAKKIYHLPVFLAVAAAWVLGFVWHSEYLFRGKWTEALRLGPSQMLQVVEWLSPHLLSVGVPLLFAYGVAWLLTLSGHQGAGWGILAAGSFWAALILASLLATGLGGVPRDLLWIEAAYTLLASVIIGAIIGGLYGRVVVEAFHQA
jgi:hypothetical protein